MNKLTILHGVHSPAAFRLRRDVPAAASVAVKSAAPATGARHGLTCTWTLDPATGRLRCSWSPLSSQQDRRSARCSQRRAIAWPRELRAA